MGMLMHHTWLEEQKKHPVKAEKPVETKEEPISESVQEPVKKTGGRRKVTK